MTLNIKDIDKVKLFVRLYNHIHANTTFGQPEKVLKSVEEGRQLLAANRFDYANFAIFCDLNKDEVDPTNYNALYGNGKAIFEQIVQDLRNEMAQSAKAGIPAQPHSAATTELKTRAEAAQNINQMNQNNNAAAGSAIPQVILRFVSFLRSPAPKTNAGPGPGSAETKDATELQALSPIKVDRKTIGLWAAATDQKLSDTSIQLMTELKKEILLLERQQQQCFAGTTVGWLSRTISPGTKSANQIALEDCLESIDFLSGTDFPTAAVTEAKYETMQSVSDWFTKHRAGESSFPSLMQEWWKEMKGKGRYVSASFSYKPGACTIKMQ